LRSRVLLVRRCRSVRPRLGTGGQAARARLPVPFRGLVKRFCAVTFTPGSITA
jgi:hypothetical protein